MKYLCFISLLFFGHFVSAQQLDVFLGVWKGELTQGEGGLRRTYDYKIVFTKIEDSKLLGKAYIMYNDDVSMKGTLAVEAVLNDQQLIIVDQKVIVNLDEKVGYWCIKTFQAKLTEKDNQYTLSGPWTGLDNCVGGTTTVFKEKKENPPKVNKAPQREERKVTIKDNVHVENYEVTIKVWDGNREDGDILSLKLNDTWILKNHLLKNEKKEIKVQLRKGENTLLLYAENLGEIPPNTAALSIDDGNRVRKITLSSDQMTSEVLKIYMK